MNIDNINTAGFPAGCRTGKATDNTLAKTEDFMRTAAAKNRIAKDKKAEEL